MEFYNRYHKRRKLAKAFAKTSELIRESSIDVNAEFDRLIDEGAVWNLAGQSKSFPGTEPGKIRRAVVVQTNLLNQLDHPFIVICPITTQVSIVENILRIRLDTGGTGLEQDSEVLVDQIRTLDKPSIFAKARKTQSKKTIEWEKVRAVLDF